MDGQETAHLMSYLCNTHAASNSQALPMHHPVWLDHLASVLYVQGVHMT